MLHQDRPQNSQSSQTKYHPERTWHVECGLHNAIVLLVDSTEYRATHIAHMVQLCMPLADCTPAWKFRHQVNLLEHVWTGVGKSRVLDGQTGKVNQKEGAQRR